ncbi:MAG TPA: 3D domain-containing protein [Candidatus Binatia bacterium]|nr:3D domain-containing protein [Candidatus Binatia bacterium]
MTDWQNAVVVDPKELNRLQTESAKLGGITRRQRMYVLTLFGANVLTAMLLFFQLRTVDDLSQNMNECRVAATQSTVALAALAKSHENMLAATEQAPSVGTKSWGRRFTVTKYIPRSAAYGRFNTGYTSTLIKADPAQRIVAVDPKLVPYGSQVWIEGLGWYRAEDCGSAIKGFRLDLLTATEKDAMEFGKQDRFVIVVPPGNANA